MRAWQHDHGCGDVRAVSQEVIEGEIVETALAVRPAAAAVAWTPSFAVAVDDMVARVEAKHEFFRRVMREDDHYGIIPGTSRKDKNGKETAKPTLLKPGAELLLASMGLQTEFSDAETPIRDYIGIEHGGEALIAYRRVCRIFKQLGPTEGERMKVAQAEGYCTSREAKYRYRNQDRACPECGAHAIKTSKFGEGEYYCYKKIDGCGAKFRLGDPAIESQPIGKIANPEIADTENTILKMADKRALVAATLIATGCSDIFTQDMEDFGSGDPPAPKPAADPKPAPAAKAERRSPPREEPPGAPDHSSALALERVLERAFGLGLIRGRETAHLATWADSKGLLPDHKMRTRWLAGIEAALDGVEAANRAAAKGYVHCELCLPGDPCKAHRPAEDAPKVYHPSTAAERPHFDSDEADDGPPDADRITRRLFALLNERGMSDKAIRLEFAAENGFAVASYKELTMEQKVALTRKLEMRPPVKA